MGHAHKRVWLCQTKPDSCNRSAIEVLISDYLNEVQVMTKTTTAMKVKQLRHRSSVTSLTRGCPRMITRIYSHVNFKNFPWKSSFSRDVEYHKTWNTRRHEIPRDVKCLETYHVHTQRPVQMGLMRITTRNNSKH